MSSSPRRSHQPGRELDTDVIMSAIHDSGWAFDRLFDHYEARVRCAAARAAQVTAYRDDVDDLTNEVWCRLLCNDRRLLAYFEPDRGPFGPFVARLAYQQALATIRWYRRQVPDVGLYDWDDGHEDPRTSSFTAELIQSDLYTKLLRRAAAELSDNDRLLLREVHLNQRTCRAVAEELGLNEDTLYQRNQRLKRKLATMVEELLGTAGTHPPLVLALIPMLLGAALSGSMALDSGGAAISDDGPTSAGAQET